MKEQFAKWKASPQGVLAVLALLVQPMVFFRDVLFGKSVHIPYDLPAFHLPLITYMARCLRQGIFPFWDPFTYCGFPFHADLQTQLYYPPNWLAVLWANHRGGADLFYWLECQNPIHMMLAGVFTYLLLRQLDCAEGVALFGATVFQLGGFFASQAQHLGAICGAAWMPLAWLAVIRLSKSFSLRWLAILSLAFGMSVLAGFPQVTVVALGSAGLLALLIGVGSGRILLPLWVAVAGLVAAMLAAIQVFPTYQLSHLSLASLRGAWYQTSGVPLQALVSLVIPNYYNVFTPSDPKLFKLPYNFTFCYVYCGIGALVLLVIAPILRKAREVRIFGALTVVCACWMLGASTPVYPMVLNLLPKFVRGTLYAEFAMSGFCLALAVCAALALHRVVGDKAPWAVWLLVFVTSVDLISSGSGRAMNTNAGGWEQQTSEWNFDGNPEMLQIVHRLIAPTTPPARTDFTYESENEWITGANMLKTPTAAGDNPFVLLRSWEVRKLYARGHDWDRYWPVEHMDSPVVDLMNIGYIFTREPLAEKDVPPNFQRVPKTLWINIYRNAKVMPRFFLVGKTYNVKNSQEGIATMKFPGFDVRRVVVVENGPPLDAAGDGIGTVEVTEYSPNQVKLRVRASRAAFLGSSETMYSGWRAKIDGKDQQLFYTNVAFRGLPVPAGEHEIVMRYRPPYFALHAAISLVTLLWLMLCIVAPESYPTMWGQLRGGIRILQQNSRAIAKTSMVLAAFVGCVFVYQQVRAFIVSRPFSPIHVRMTPAKVKAGGAYVIEIPELAGKRIDLQVSFKGKQGEVDGFCELDKSGRATINVPADIPPGVVEVKGVRRTARDLWISANGSIEVVP